MAISLLLKFSKDNIVKYETVGRRTVKKALNTLVTQLSFLLSFYFCGPSDRHPSQNQLVVRGQMVRGQMVRGFTLSNLHDIRPLKHLKNFVFSHSKHYKLIWFSDILDHITQNL